MLTSSPTISSIISPTIPRRTHYNIHHTNINQDHTNTNIIGGNSRIHELGNGSEEHDDDDYTGEVEDSSMTQYSHRISPVNCTYLWGYETNEFIFE